MKFKPLHDNVLVKRIEEDEKTAGGILLPDTAKEKTLSRGNSCRWPRGFGRGWQTQTNEC